MIRQLKTMIPDADIVILTSHDDAKLIFEALCNGAVGYLTKGATLSTIYDSLQDNESFLIIDLYKQ